MLSDKKPVVKQKLLLHVCCATCAAYVLNCLKCDYKVTAFYYNPNIYPDKEYKIRFLEVKNYCQEKNISFIEEPPDRNKWFLLIKGHENDLERGERCTICYRMRLERTANYAKKYKFDKFGTDLSISPHKDARRLNKLGKELEKLYSVSYLDADFKKLDGFKKAMELSKKEGFYRQNYCGCVYSIRRHRLEG